MHNIFSLMDMIHLVHEGIDPKRYIGTEVGKLALHGQGNCHTLASVLAGLLLPFGPIIGIKFTFFFFIIKN